MPRKLKLDGLRVDLSAVEGLLKEAEEFNDLVGVLQYGIRRDELLKQIEEVSQTYEPQASVALFFGGKPVLGSRGIMVDFAGAVLETFQEIISKRFAETESGHMGSRGPVPLSSNTNLMVTGIAKGSFGFILDELNDQTSLCDTSLKVVVDDVSKLIEHIAAPDEEDFEQATEELDKRTLKALREFFKSLDSQGATIRIVEGLREFSLDSHAIHRGRVRTEATSINEKEEPLAGVIMGFLPEHKTFELRLPDGEVIYGTASKDAAIEYATYLKTLEDPLNVEWQTHMQIREVTALRREPKVVYKLLGLSPKK